MPKTADHGLFAAEGSQCVQPGLPGCLARGFDALERVILAQAQAFIFPRVVISHQLDAAQVWVAARNRGDPGQVLGAVVDAGYKRAAQDDRRAALVMERLNHMPHIYFSATPDHPEASWIDSDGREGAAQAVRHLMGRGHARIGYLIPSDGYDQHNAVDRLQGAQEEMNRAGLELVVYSAREWQEFLSLEQILADRITALITWNDVLALRVIGQLQRKGLRVPEDLALVGFDDELFSRWTYPTITTFAQPIAEMGKAAVE